MRKHYGTVGSLACVDVYGAPDNMPTRLTFEVGRTIGEKLFRIRNAQGHLLSDGYVREEHMQEAHTFMDFLKARA